MTEIQSFLHNPTNYFQGVELLKKYAPDSPALILCAISENSVTWKALLKALQDVPLPEERSSVSAKAPKYSGEAKASWPEQITRIYNDSIELMRRRSLVHMKLSDLIYGKTGEVKRFSEKKAAQFATEIMEISAHIDVLMYQVDYWMENGTFAPGTIPMDERQKLIYWLTNQMNYAGYCRNVEAAKRTENNPLYTYRKSVLGEIDQFLTLNGTIR